MKNIRNLIVGMIAGALLATAGSAFAAPALQKVSALVRPDYSVKVDGKKVDIQHAPLTYDGTTYVPLREAGEILGYNVGFDSGTITLDSTSKGADNSMSETTTTEPTGTSEADPIDLSQWVSTKSLESSGLSWKIGLPEGAPVDTKEREYKLIYNDKTESFIIPDAMVLPYISTNANGVELLFQTGGPYIKKSFAEQFVAQ